LKKPEIDLKYFEKHFFKAEFMSWETNDVYPYCQLVEECGPLFVEATYRKVIMLSQGITEESYPKAAIDEVD
jgi:hypothetical protein